MMRPGALLATLALIACDGPSADEAADTAADTTTRQGAQQDTAAADVTEETGAEQLPGQASLPAKVGCGDDEQVIFSCPVQGGKTIAVCGKDGEVEYRFGDRVPELAIRGGRFASVPYSGGGEAQIAFANGDTQYIVFSRIVRTNFAVGEPNDPEFTDGVAILRGGQSIGEKLCKPGSVESVDVNSAERYGGAASELFYNG